MTGTEKTFRRFTENNDWEGEVWHFWLQVQGNEVELEKFGQELERLYGDSEPATRTYVLSEEVLPEYDVNILADNADESGYMADQQVVEGVFTCPDIDGTDAEDLYKGGIADFFAKGDVA